MLVIFTFFCVLVAKMEGQPLGDDEIQMTTTGDGCWKRVSNCKLSCVRPMSRRSTGSESACLEMCKATPNCQGVVFNRYVSREGCELYDKVPVEESSEEGGPDFRRRPGPGPGPGGRRPPQPWGGRGSSGGGWRGGPPPRPSGSGSGAWGGRRWRRARDTSPLLSSSSSLGTHNDDASNMGIPVIDDPGTMIDDIGGEPIDDRRRGGWGRGGPSSRGSGSRGGYRGGRGRKSSSEESGGGNRRRPSNRCITGARGSTVYKWTGECRRRPLSSTVWPPTTRTTRSTTTAVTTRPVPSTFTCSPGDTIRYMTIKDFQNTGPVSGTFTTSALEDCLRACERNQLPNGQQALCRSVSYNSAARECRLHESVIDHQSGLNGAKTPGATYYEKVCVRGSVVTGCSDRVETIPQQILIGHATNILTRGSYVDCIKACYEASSSNNAASKCVSAQYFFEFDEENCVLNNVGKTDFPDLMIEETEFRVNYFEIDCRNTNPFMVDDDMAKQQNLIEVGKSEWGPWSPCDRESNRKVRFRNCERNIPKTCESEKSQC